MSVGWSGTFLDSRKLKVPLSLCSTPPTTTKLFFVLAFGVFGKQFIQTAEGEDFYFQRVLEPLVNYEHFKQQ